VRDGLIAVRVGRLSYHQPYFQPMGLEAEAEGPHLGHWVHSQLHRPHGMGRQTKELTAHGLTIQSLFFSFLFCDSLTIVSVTHDYTLITVH
jgi:hypothetical protein